jgi:hypothetical protein
MLATLDSKSVAPVNGATTTVSSCDFPRIEPPSNGIEARMARRPNIPNQTVPVIVGSISCRENELRCSEKKQNARLPAAKNPNF